MTVSDAAARLHALAEDVPRGLVAEADNQVNAILQQAIGMLGDTTHAADLAGVVAGVQDVLHTAQDAMATLENRLNAIAVQLMS